MEPITMLLLASSAIKGAAALRNYSTTRAAGKANYLAAQSEAAQVEQAGGQDLALASHRAAQRLEMGRRNLAMMTAAAASRGGDTSDPTTQALLAREKQTHETDSLLDVYEGLVQQRDATLKADAIRRGATYERRAANFRARSQLAADVADIAGSWAGRFGPKPAQAPTQTRTSGRGGMGPRNPTQTRRYPPSPY